MTVAGICFVNYLIAGFIQNAAICLIIGAGLVIGTLVVIRSLVNKNSAEP